MSTKNLNKAKGALNEYNRLLKFARETGLEIGTYKQEAPAHKPEPAKRPAKNIAELVMQTSHLAKLNTIVTKGEVWSHAEIRPDGILTTKLCYGNRRKDIYLGIGFEIFWLGAGTSLTIHDVNEVQAIDLVYRSDTMESPSWHLYEWKEGQLSSLLMSECVLPVIGEDTRTEQQQRLKQYRTISEHLIEPLVKSLCTWFSRLPTE